MDELNIIVLAGPNGAGKSTIAKKIVRDRLGIFHYVNADTLARGLSEFDSECMALKAGRIMLDHLHELARQRLSFGFETTLAGKTYARWLADCRQQGYLFHLVFLWLPSADMAIDRVRDRVLRGGHSIPEDTIRRRFEAGLKNFFCLYEPLTDSFQFYDNSHPEQPRLIASKSDKILTVEEAGLWQAIQTNVTT